MNWDRGLTRITLVLSIVSAVIAAGRSGYHARDTWAESNDDLTRKRDRRFYESDGRSLIDSWTNRPKLSGSASEDDRVWWRALTGWELGKGPWWENDRIVGESEEERKTRLEARLRELELLKKQGWRTANGEALSLTPKEAWQIKHGIEIEALEHTVRKNKIGILGYTVLGAWYGFVGIWIVYALVKAGAWPLYKWISRGFQEGKQKDGQQHGGVR